MNRKRIGIILMVFGILLALGVGIVVYMQMEQAAEIAKRTPTVDVVVATADLPERVAVPASAVAVTKIPAEVVPVDAATKVDTVAGKFPLTRIYKGEVVIQAKLADTSGKTGPAFTLKDGFVAVTYPGNDLLTTTGAIRPGDRIDVLLTLPLLRTSTTPAQSGGSQAGQVASSLPQVTQTLLQRVEVLRVGGFPTAGQEAAAAGKGITFQVSHQDALILKWAKDAGGTIDLVLRHPSDNEPIPTEAITANYILRQFKFTFAEPLQ
ncbi:MAG: Flp pilus assembly protein CpaB [Chloroflexota bacterium]